MISSMVLNMIHHFNGVGQEEGEWTGPSTAGILERN